VKDKQRALAEAGKRLSENKHLMLKEHKQECFDRFLEIRQTHERFWAYYNERKERRLEERRGRREEFEQRVRANIEKNQEKLEKAESFRDQQQARVNELQEKVDGDNSARWQAIFEQRLAEAEEKVRSAENQIGRVRQWIRDDEDKVRG